MNIKKKCQADKENGSHTNKELTVWAQRLDLTIRYIHLSEKFISK